MPRPQPAPTALGGRPAHPFTPPAEAPAAPPVTEQPQPATSVAVAPPAAAETSESTRNFSTRLTPALQRRLKRFAVDNDTSVQEVVAAAVTEYLDQKEQ